MVVLFVVFLFSAQFFSYMMKQRKLSNRMGQQQLMAKVAQSLAGLALHKIHYAPVCNDNDGQTSFPTDSTPGLNRIYSWLSAPLEEMTDLEPVEIDLENDPGTVQLTAVLDPLTQPLREGMDFEYAITVSGRKKDFRSCGLNDRGYPREKQGLIHLSVKTSYARPGQPKMTEEFRFLGRVKITAAIAPVLSKFSLYVENAGFPGITNMAGYNAVSVKDNGDVLPNSLPQPIVLDNDGEGLQIPVQKTYQDFVTAARGLVFLGGESNLLLNVSRSDKSNTTSNSGEEFQFFRDGLDGAIPVGDNTLPDGAVVLISQIEKGVSNADTPRNKTFYDPIEKFSSYGRTAVECLRMKYSSIFRLCGVDGNKSPTLVLGKVKSNFLLYRLFSLIPPPPGSRKILLECIDYDIFHARIQSSYLPLARAYDVNDSFAFGYPKYLRGFCSFVASKSWNIGLGYMYRQSEANPFSEFPADDKLRQYMSPSVSDELLFEIPDPVKPIMSQTPEANLKEMAPFLELLKRDDRLVYEIPRDGETGDWKEMLRRRGLLSDGKLALNGWVKIKGPATLEIDQPLEFITNGGLIVEEGDIFIRAPITPSEVVPIRKNVILQIVALNGNIHLETQSGAKVQAHLIANGDGNTTGKIIFAGRPRIIGALAMKRLINTGTELEGFFGADLAYYPPLATLPQAPQETSEFPLLGYQFENVPVILE